MRVLYQCESFLPDTIGGVEVLSAQYLKALQARGHEVLVIATRIGTRPTGWQSYEGIPVLKLDFGGALDSKDLPRMHAVSEAVLSAIGTFKPDVIHLNDVRPSSFFFLNRGPKTDFPFVLSLHGPVEALAFHGIQARLLRQAHRLVAVSEAQCRAAVAFDPGLASRITVIHNALVTPNLAPSALSFARPQLLCIGRLVEEKGFDVALRAFAGLLERRQGVALTIAGDGPQRPVLEQLARALGVAAAVRVLGWVEPDEIPGLINQACLVVMPSRWPEPFGLVALQAAQMARPLVATARGGLAEVVEDGRTGLLVPPEDPQALRVAIETLLNDPPRAQQMGHEARARAQARFDPATMVSAYEAEYQTARQSFAEDRRGG